MKELQISAKTRAALDEFTAYVADLCLEESEAERVSDLLAAFGGSLAEDAFAFGVSMGVKSAIESAKEAFLVEETAP